MKLISILSSLIIAGPHVEAWGTDGHKIVAFIAENLLNMHTKTEIDTLIPNQSIVDIASWADEADHTPAYAWSKCMHYVDSDHGMCAVDIQSSCGGPEGCCVINAIANYTNRLGDNSLLHNQRVEALKFLVHFAGDVAQPLHAGSRQDRGGNNIHVRPEFRKDQEINSHPESNLHSVWDTTIIEEFLHEEKFTFVGFAKKILDSLISNPNTDIWLKECAASGDQVLQCPLHASEESASIACESAYVHPDGSEIRSGDVLSREYYSSRVQVIQDRLASAGVRLASILNSVFSADRYALLPEFEIL
jgi:hypothetical protein